jgi:preprotein translocase subunit SecD
LPDAQNLLQREFSGLDIDSSQVQGEKHLIVRLSESEVEDLSEFALTQNITALRNRIDELGVAAPVVQRQGDRRIVIQLPGVQDTARAKRILGRTATLEMMLVDEEHSLEAAQNGKTPPGSRLYRMRDGRSILLKKRVIYSGENIVDAAASIDTQNGGPIVSITLDAVGSRINQRITGDNIGKRMAVVYIEIRSRNKINADCLVVTDQQGRVVRVKERIEEVITAPVIRDQLGKRFQIEGLDSVTEARDLALLLRAGSLAAPVEIIEERTVGPSLGRANIEQGFLSVIIGFGLVLVFMLLYYRTFGLFANTALGLNLVLIVAVLSMFQATLTLPGVAGIVLTVGMAVDANVLIFERIREELRNGNTPQASIHLGYDRALSTIVDANITTLIAAIVLFNFGTGPIKGFAVTLSIGILTSMFTAIFVTRGLANLMYGRKRVKSLAI